MLFFAVIRRLFVVTGDYLLVCEEFLWKALDLRGRKRASNDSFQSSEYRQIVDVK